MLVDITIQPYNDVYKEAIISLILGIQQDEFGIAITREDQPDLSNITHYYQINQGNFWLALQGDQVVGTIALLDIGHHQGALRKMFVRAGYRGRQFGIGQQLLNTLFAWAEQHQFTDIFLGTTSKFIAAHRFYEKNRFSAIDKHQLPDTFPIVTVDTVFYHRII